MQELRNRQLGCHEQKDSEAQYLIAIDRMLQDCLLRGRPISEALDLWGTCEAPGTPGARARIAAGSKGKPTAGTASRWAWVPLDCTCTTLTGE